jgi:cytochrome c oxidase subunit 1
MEQNAAYEGQQIYHPKGWWGHYVFSQDHKIIALQYT